MSTKSLSKIYESEVVRKGKSETAYEQAAMKVETQLDQIRTLIQDHAERRLQSPEDWGWAGDLNKVSADLAHLIIFLGEGLH